MTERGATPKDSRTGGNGRQRPDDAATARTASARLWLRWFLLALFAAVLTSSLALPWKVLGLVLALTALAFGVVALVKSIGAKLHRMVVVSTSVGIAASLFLVAGIGASVALWPVTRTYEECMSRALTLQATSECEDGLRQFDGF